MPHKIPRPKIFNTFAIRWSVFEIRANFVKSAPNDTKMILACSRLKYPYAYYMHPRGSDFHRFCSTMSRLRVTPLFSESATNDPQMTLTGSRSKVRIYMLNTPPRPKFWFSFPYRVMGQFCEKCTERPQNDLHMFKVKGTHIHSKYIQEDQIVIRFAVQ